MRSALGLPVKIQLPPTPSWCRCDFQCGQNCVSNMPFSMPLLIR